MEKILITGVAGFIGSHVARRFLKAGYEVVGVDDLSGGRFENIPENIEFINGDLALKETFERIPKGCKKVLHLAGQSSGEISFDNPVDDLKKNTISTLNLINYGIQNGAGRLVYASSMSIYGAVADVPIREKEATRPLSCYGVGKLAAEDYLRIFQKQLPFVGLRMFNVYGPGQDLGNLRQGMVSIFLAQALANGRIEVKGGIERFRDFIYIEDVVEAWFRAATYPAALNQIINVGTGKRTTVAMLLNQICDLVPGSSFFVKGSTPGDQKGIFADVKKINNILGIRSFLSIEKGLRLFVDWAHSKSLI